MSVGGWNILNKWLVEAKKTENFPVLLELLEVRDLVARVDETLSNVFMHIHLF